MIRPEQDEIKDPRQLLDLWMKDVHLDAEPRRRSKALVSLAWVSAIVAGIVLAKYAVDLLVLGLGIVLGIFVIREVMRILATSVLLSGTSMVVIALLGGLAAWLWLPHSTNGLLPRPIVRALDAAQAHGWGFTVLPSEPSPDTGSAQAARPAPESAAPAPPSVVANYGALAPTVTISSSQPSTVQGQPVVFTARLGSASQSSSAATVRFFDGTTLLGEGVVRTEGAVRVAYLPVATLGEGRHEIVAEVVGVGAGGRSLPLRHTVTARGGR